METSATTQSATTTSKQARTPKPMNGVDTPTLFATIGAVKGQPELASFQFRATNRWQQGTHSRTRIEGFHGAGGEHEHAREEFGYDADRGGPGRARPGSHAGRVPAHAIAACLTAGIGNIASARGVTLYEVESTVEGDIDVRGILGLSETSERLPPAPRELPDQGRRAGGEARGDRRAVAGPVGRPRRADGHNVPVQTSR